MFFIPSYRERKTQFCDGTERLDELQRHFEKLDGADEDYRNRVLGETLFVRNSHISIIYLK